MTSSNRRPASTQVTNDTVAGVTYYVQAVDSEGPRAASSWSFRTAPSQPVGGGAVAQPAASRRPPPSILHDGDGRGWRGERLELVARAFVAPIELSPVIGPSEALALDMVDGRIEGIVLKDRESTYRDGSRAGWYKIKDRGWYEREAWRFDRR